MPLKQEFKIFTAFINQRGNFQIASVSSIFSIHKNMYENLKNPMTPLRRFTSPIISTFLKLNRLKL